MKICVDCSVEMRCVKNGHLVITSVGVFDGDRYACPRCGAEIIDGIAREPYINASESEYAERLRAQRAAVGVGNSTTLDENWSTL